MTVTVETNRNDETGNGIQTVFPFTFELLSADHMVVYVNNALQSTGYAVSINDNGVGGNVTFDTAPSNGFNIILLRDVPMQQGTVLPIESNLPESVLETMSDRLTMICLQIKEILNRAFTAPVWLNETFAMPAPEALKLIRWNGAANSIENVSFGTLLSDYNPGAGNVVGPGTSTDHRIALWNGTTGKLLKDGPAMTTAGHVLTSNGASADPTFQAPVHAPDFTSADQALSSGGTLAIPHGLGAAPRQVWFALVCQTAELGYSIGDVVFNWSQMAQTGVDAGVVFWVDGTNINVQYASNGATGVFHLARRSATTGDVGPITNANWKMRVFANK